jgi:hypothetical protein
MITQFKVAILLTLCLTPSEVLSQDSKASRTLTFIGTFKGEITKVADKGNKIDVEYKELVTSATRSSGTTIRGGASGKYRPPLPREFTFKEKKKELELRVFDETIIRVLDNSQMPAGKINTTRKQQAKEDDETGRSQVEDDRSNKSLSKTSRKRSEPPLPGKAVDRSSLAKGQVVIVQVAREDLQGFSRLVATSIVILGEK